MYFSFQDGCGIRTRSRIVGGYKAAPHSWPWQVMPIRVGAHHRTKPNKWVQDLRVRQIYRHPKYNDPVMWANDVALLLLDRPAQLNSAVRPICLPDKDDQPGTDCTVTGWGRLSHSGSDPDYLMQVNAPFKVEHILLLK